MPFNAVNPLKQSTHSVDVFHLECDDDTAECKTVANVVSNSDATWRRIATRDSTY